MSQHFHRSNKKDQVSRPTNDQSPGSSSGVRTLTRQVEDPPVKRFTTSRIGDMLKRPFSRQPSRSTTKQERVKDTLANEHARHRFDDTCVLDAENVLSEQASLPNKDPTATDDSKLASIDGVVNAIDLLHYVSGIDDLNFPTLVVPVLGRITSVLDILRQMMENRTSFRELTRTLGNHRASFHDQLRRLKAADRGPNSHSPLLAPIKRYASILEQLLAAIIKESGVADGNISDRGACEKLKNFSSRFINASADQAQVRKYISQVSDAMSALQTTLIPYIRESARKVGGEMGKQAAMSMDFGNSHIKSGGAPVASYNQVMIQPSALNNLERPFATGLIHDECLPDTRIPILEKIREWANGEAEKRMFWLNDVAGSGKSTVAFTMAKEWRRQERLGGSFFFSISDEKAAGTTAFCSILARNIHGYMPALRPKIEEAAKDTMIAVQPFEEQFTKLICEPLLDHHQTVVLVIDAVDECKDLRQRKIMLQTLVAKISIIPHLKVFLTSRPVPDIGAIVSPAAVVCGMEFLLHGVEHRHNVDDITTYIEHHLSSRLNAPQRAQLVERAGGLFIWASTATKILEQSPKRADVVMESLLSANQSTHINRLDSLYQLVLQRALPDEDWEDMLYGALAALAVVNEPISISTLKRLMPTDGRVEEIIGHLGSVLKIGGEDGRIHFRHPTFREYLQRCNSPPLRIDTTTAHLHIASTTLGMLSKLPMDVFGIWEKGTSAPSNDEIEEVASRLTSLGELTLYSAKHWSFHNALALDNAEVVKLVTEFLNKDLLNWLELIGWMRNVQKSLSGLVYLRKALRNYADSSDDHTLIRTCIDEAIRFGQSNQALIERVALQVHLSAILFSPQETWIYKTYMGRTGRKGPNVLSGIPRRWPTHHILAGHGDAISCLAFSPDGKHVVSGSDDDTLRLWDVDSGAQIGSALEGHSRPVSCLAFSPDGKRVVCGSDDSTLRAWDTESGTQIGSAFEGHSNSVLCLAFSPDGVCLASGSRDNTLRLWDVESGAQIGSALGGHSGPVNCLAFSSDGKRIVSGSGDKTLRLWDTKSGAQLGSALEGHSGPVNCLAFSSGRKRIVSGSGDSTLRLWDAESGVQLGSPLEGHSGPINCLVLSLDGNRVVSGSSDNTLRIWDAESGAEIGSALEGHSRSIICLELSSDGKRVVSGSRDSTLRIWDMESGAQIGSALKGHSNSVRCLAISPDGKRVVSGSDDDTLRLWDAESGTHIGSAPEGHSQSVTCLAFSPNGKRVASGSDDRTLRLWDAESGAQIGGALKGHSHSVNCLAFLPDGKRVVSGSDDTTLRLWDAESGAKIGSALEGHSHSVSCLAFSPDGKRVVSGSWDHTLRIWDAESGAQVGSALEGHSGSVICLTFSPDGKRVVSGSNDTTLRLWDVESGGLVVAIDIGPIYDPSSLHFSSDSSAVYFQDRKWSVPPAGIVEDFGHVRLSSEPQGISAIRYDYENHAIAIYGMPEHLYFLPMEFSVEIWKAHGGVVVLGASDGRVMIVDLTQLLCNIS